VQEKHLLLASTADMHDKSLPVEKTKSEDQQVEQVETYDVGNLVFDQDEEPELRARTYIALVALLLLQLVMLIALQGPPAFVSGTTWLPHPFLKARSDLSLLIQLDNIGESLDASASQSWVPNVLMLVQASLGPLVSAASDTFQARKSILLVACVFAFVGAAIAPGSRSIARLISAQILIGAGFASAGISYSIPSEILPRRWRPSTSTKKEKKAQNDSAF
jgi:MFS family permease